MNLMFDRIFLNRPQAAFSRRPACLLRDELTRKAGKHLLASFFSPSFLPLKLDGEETRLLF